MPEKIPLPDKEELRELYWGEELTMSDLGEEYDVHPGTVRKWMEEYDIPRRDGVEAAIEKRRVGYALLRMLQDGHYVWQTSYEYEAEYVRVPRLLAIAEYGFDAVCDKVVHHKNEIPWDDRPDNIELMDNGEHTKHHTKTGTEHHDSKLTEEDVREIREAYDQTDKTQYDIADEYGVTQKTIHKIVTGKTWAWLD